MIDMPINQRLIYYASQTGVETLYDEDGYETGETKPTYDEPKELWINVSAAAGRAQYIAFGHFSQYTRTLITSDTQCPIKLYDAIWLNVDPTDGPNYTVVRVADGLDSIMYAIQEVAG